MVSGELGRYPLANHIKHRIVNFWAKLIHKSESNIAFTIYSLIFQMHNTQGYQSDWLNCVLV